MMGRVVGWLRRWLPLACAWGAYGLLATAGLLAFFRPSPSLLVQGGYYVVIPWGVVCILGGTLGMVALVTEKLLIRLLATQISALASLTWAASLVLQTTTQSTAITAACMAGVMTLMFTQGWVNAYRESRRK